MTAILFFTLLGFLTGLVYVMVKRKIKPGAILASTFLAFLATGIYKIFQESYRRNKRRHHF